MNVYRVTSMWMDYYLKHFPYFFLHIHGFTSPSFFLHEVAISYRLMQSRKIKTKVFADNAISVFMTYSTLPQIACGAEICYSW